MAGGRPPFSEGVTFMEKLIKGLEKIQVAVAAVFLLIFLVTIAIQIGTRFAGIPATWTEDVSMYSFIWAVFMGAAAMVSEKRHFAFTSVMDSLKSDTAKNVLQIIISFIMLFFAILMLVYGTQITKQFWNYTWTNIPSFKRGPTWLCLPICGGTSAIYLIYQIYEEFRAFGGKR